MKTKSITKREGGITLISLIVMIILLVIISAVTIRGITGKERDTSEVQQQQFKSILLKNIEKK